MIYLEYSTVLSLSLRVCVARAFLLGRLFLLLFTLFTRPSWMAAATATVPAAARRKGSSSEVTGEASMLRVLRLRLRVN